jgi:hypothetical protein
MKEMTGIRIVFNRNSYLTRHLDFEKVKSMINNIDKEDEFYESSYKDMVDQLPEEWWLHLDDASKSQDNAYLFGREMKVGDVVEDLINELIATDGLEKEIMSSGYEDDDDHEHYIESVEITLND